MLQCTSQPKLSFRPYNLCFNKLNRARLLFSTNEKESERERAREIDEFTKAQNSIKKQCLVIVSITLVNLNWQPLISSSLLLANR